MNLLISKELAQAIHDYLHNRPMIEVESLVIAIRELKKQEEIIKNETTVSS